MGQIPTYVCMGTSVSPKEITISAYKGLEATTANTEVTDDEVKARLDALVERNARVITVEDRAAQNDDIAVIDFEGFVDGVAFEGGKGDNYELTLGSGTFIPGFEDQIVGHNVGDEFDVNVTFPEQYTEELAGKEAVFKCKLNELKAKELPEVNDEFAQDAADCDTVADLDKQLREEIAADKKANADREVENQLMEKLAENVEGEIPYVMVDSEVDNQIRDLDYRFSSQGMSFETYLQYTGMTIEQYRESAKAGAEKNVKVRLALEKIAKDEALEVSDEEIDAEYNKFAEQYKMEIDQIKAVVPADGLKNDLLFNKAVEFVKNNAVVTEKAEDAE